jgi:hypothetical protein
LMLRGENMRQFMTSAHDPARGETRVASSRHTFCRTEIR